MWRPDRLIGALLCAAFACGSDEPPKGSPPPAKVANGITEAQLTTVTLTEAAEKRLGVTVGTIERKPAGLTRVLPGEIEPVAGGSATLAAPVAGVVTAASAAAPAPGRAVKRGEVIWRLRPLLTAERDLAGRMTRDVSASRARVEAARSKATRTETLARAGAASERAAEEARSELKIAEADLAEAQGRRGGGMADATIELRAPEAGVILRVGAAPGQVVTAGAVLVEIARVDRAWVRVPLYVGDLGSVDRARSAHIRPLGAEGDAAGRQADPVDVPPLAQPNGATVEILYTVDNADRTYLPGQKVSVSLPVAGEAEALVVPWSAVLYDIHGGAWVYEVTAPHVFARRRVEVRAVQDDLAVLARGPAAGTRVVTTAASELYGTEFGAGK